MKAQSPSTNKYTNEVSNWTWIQIIGKNWVFMQSIEFHEGTRLKWLQTCYMDRTSWAKEWIFLSSGLIAWLLIKWKLNVDFSFKEDRTWGPSVDCWAENFGFVKSPWTGLNDHRLTWFSFIFWKSIGPPMLDWRRTKSKFKCGDCCLGLKTNPMAHIHWRLL